MTDNEIRAWIEAQKKKEAHAIRITAISSLIVMMLIIFCFVLLLP